VEIYVLLVREDSFTLWSEKALLPCKWQSSKRSKLALKKGELEIQIDTRIHLMEWLVVTIDAEHS
jgi:hypothetical protein